MMSWSEWDRSLIDRKLLTETARLVFEHLSVLGKDDYSFAVRDVLGSVCNWPRHVMTCASFPHCARVRVCDGWNKNVAGFKRDRCGRYEGKQAEKKSTEEEWECWGERLGVHLVDESEKSWTLSDSLQGRQTRVYEKVFVVEVVYGKTKVWWNSEERGTLYTDEPRWNLTRLRPLRACDVDITGEEGRTSLRRRRWIMIEGSAGFSSPWSSDILCTVTRCHAVWALLAQSSTVLESTPARLFTLHFIAQSSTACIPCFLSNQHCSLAATYA